MITKKRIFITLATVIILAGFIFLGIRVFAYKIYNQRTCEWANIDNIELHTMVDIPSINDCGCQYDKSSNTKKAHFDINKGKVDVASYIINNGFKKLNSENELSFFEKDSSIINLHSELFYKNGSQKGESWEMLLNKTSGSLWIILKYVD